MKVSIAVKVVGIYLIVGCLWIFFSDRLLQYLTRHPDETITHLQTLKGSFYVLATSGLLYWLIHWETKANRLTTKKLKQALGELYRTQNALKHSENRFRAFMDNSPAVSWVTDAKGRFEYVSQTYLQLFQTPCEVVGQSIFDVYPHDIAQVYLDNIQTVAKSGQVLEVIEPGIRPDGQRGQFLVYKFPLPQPDGKLHVGGVAVDITERLHAEAKLQEREALLRLFAQYAPADIAMFDQKMRYVMASQRWANDFHADSVESLIGHVHYEMFPEIPDQWRQVNQRCLAGATEKCDEELVVRADGRKQWKQWEVRPWYTANGEIGGIIIFSLDITQRKQAEVALQALNADLEQRVASRTSELKALSDRLMEAQEIAHIGSWECDGTMGQVFWSDELFRIFGLEPEQSELSYENRLMQHLPSQDRERLQQAILRAKEYREPYELDLQLIRADGSAGWILAKGKPILNEQNQVVRLVGIAMDITERKAVEVEQARLSQLKDDFLSTVSHELRSPLTSIKMAIHMLEIALDRVLATSELKIQAQSHRLQRYLEILREQCDQELELINNLLDLQRLESERIQINVIPINVAEWASNIAGAFEEGMRERQQHLHLCLPSDLLCLSSDIDILTSVLRELLTNACKYTPNGEVITVNADLLEGQFQLRVSNSGVQIAQEELERIFDKFYRIPKSDQWKQGGTGLGLALIKKQVEYLGGTIRAESNGSGVCFIVTLPLDKANEA